MTEVTYQFTLNNGNALNLVVRNQEIIGGTIFTNNQVSIPILIYKTADGGNLLESNSNLTGDWTVEKNVIKINIQYTLTTPAYSPYSLGYPNLATQTSTLSYPYLVANTFTINIEPVADEGLKTYLKRLLK